MGFFAFIFTFLLGAVVALLAAAYSIYYVLIVVEKKTDSQRQKLAKAVSPEESQRAVQLLIPELKTKVRFSFTPAPWPKDAAKRMQQTAIVLKANMFFHFLDEKRDACNIARLDNCAIELIRHEGKAKFNKKSYIKIVSPGGSLFPDAAAPSGSTAGKSTADTCYIKFFNGKDLEQWYYALKSATSLTITREVKQVEMMQAQQRYFAHLTAVANNSAEVNADWANALLGRVFWSIHNHPVFLNLITEKLQKKIAKLKRPKFVESISVTDVGFGPNLPLFSNIKIISVTPQGALAFDGDVYYHGGFNLMIDINLRIDLPIGNVSVEVPIRASVVVKTFAGRGHIQVAPPPAKRAWIGFYGEPRVDMDIKIEVGKNLSLVNIPSLANIVINKIKQQLIKKLVLPAMDDWPLPHIPSKKVPETAVAAESSASEKDSAHPSALLSSRAGAGITSTQLSQTSAASSPAQSRQSERAASFSSSSTAPLSVSSSAVTTKRHSVAVLPGGHALTGSVGTASAAGAKAQPTITVKTRASPAERVRNDHSQPSGALGPPPLPARTHSAPSKILPPESPLLESDASGYKPLMALAGATGANANLSSLQVPSAPPRNSTDEWYQNSLLALRDRDDSDGSDGSDGEDPRGEQQARQLHEEHERQAKENKEKEERERKAQEDKEKERSKQEQEERERAERERVVKEEKEQKEREDQERRDLEATNKVETPVEPLSSTPVVRKSLSERQNSDDAREIEQFTPLEKPETSRRETVTMDDESKARQEREREEAREQREREEKERKEREEEEEREKQRRLAEEQERAEKRRKEEQEEKERKEKERKAAEEAEKQAKERELRSGGGLQVTRLEAFTDPLSSSLNNPLFDEIFGTTTDDSDDEPPRRQSTFDGAMASAPLLPDAPHRRRSGSLNLTPSLAPTPAPAPASAPALPPRAHEQQVSTVTSGSASTKPMSAPTPTPAGGSSKGRTTSHMFEDFDFSFPSAAPSSSSTSSPRTSSSPSSVASFLGLATPALPASPPRASAPTPSSAANTTDNLFSFSTTSSSSSSSVSSSSSAAKPGAKKGLFNLDMEDIFNKVEKQHHLVEKFKAAKTRAQNAIHDWNTPHGAGGGAGGGGGGGDSGQEL